MNDSIQTVSGKPHCWPQEHFVLTLLYLLLRLLAAGRANSIWMLVSPLLVNYWFERMELWLDKQQEVRKGVKVRAGFVLRVDIFSVALRSEPRPVRTCGCVLWLVWGCWAGEAILQDNLKRAQIPVAISQNKLPALQQHHSQQKSRK